MARRANIYLLLGLTLGIGSSAWSTRPTTAR